MSNSTTPSRRRFFLVAPAAAVGLAAPALAAADCRVSDGDILGPFYRPGARAMVKLADASAQGERLMLTGTVLRPDCKAPVAGATRTAPRLSRVTRSRTSP